TILRTTTANTAKTRNFSARNIRCRVIVFSSRVQELVVDGLEAPAQAEDRIVLARDQRVPPQPCLRRQLFEAPPFDLMRDQDAALIVRQLVQGSLDLLEKHLSGVSRLGSGVGRRQQVFEQQRLFPDDGRRTFY